MDFDDDNLLINIHDVIASLFESFGRTSFDWPHDSFSPHVQLVFLQPLIYRFEALKVDVLFWDDSGDEPSIDSRLSLLLMLPLLMMTIMGLMVVLAGSGHHE